MPRPHDLRPSKLRARKGDEITGAGGWTRARLIRMDARFRAAMKREMSRRPQREFCGDGTLSSRPPPASH